METVNSEYQVKAYVESRIGGRNENQDSYGYADTTLGFLMVVCDGMGGRKGGKTASTIAVQTIIDYIKNAEDNGSIPVLLAKAMDEANKQIIAAAESDMSLRGMGTTATALLVSDKAAYVAHVGDSRIYQIRRGKKIFRTFDHSMVFDLVKKKVLTEEQARLSAQSNIITRALGVKNEVVVDTNTLNYRKGDRFVLCSDGFYSVMPEKEFLQGIGAKGQLNLILDNFAEKVDNIGKQSGGGHDNLTGAVVEVKTTTDGETKKNIIRLAAIALALVIVAGFVAVIANSNNKIEKISNDKLSVIWYYKHDSTVINRIDSIFKTDTTENVKVYKIDKKDTILKETYSNPSKKQTKAIK